MRLTNILIYIGSALMVYNIIRYGSFVKSSRKLEGQGHKNELLIVPLLLLVFFLIGYLVVAVSGIANLLMAAILFGGSVFVFLQLTVMYSIVNHIRATDRVLSARYEEMRAELGVMTKDSLAVFLVNLTRDEVEDRAGANLSEEDLRCESYAELLRARGARVIDPDYAGPELSRIRREELLRIYGEGQTSISEVLLVRQADGLPTYVQIEVALTKMPVSGDVIAFLTERPYNEQVVNDTLLESVLMDQYDRIAYLIDGHYHPLISDSNQKKGKLLPDDEGETDYESLYYNYILPAQPKDREKSDGPNPLRLSVIDKALAENTVYDVNAPFVIDGETRYKHIVFYRIDHRAKFYLMLLSDSTSVQEEQIARNKQLTDALAEAVRSNQARVSFFTNMSHELRTPMNGILGFTSLAMDESDPQKVRDYLGKVDFSGRRLLTLIEDLFTMSLIDSGDFRFAVGPTDLRATAESLRERFAARRGGKDLGFLCDTDALTDPVVFCDGERLSQLLARLVENSCAFAPEGSTVRLTLIQTPSEDPQRGSYEFHIRSRGVGIPEKVMDHVFEAEAWADYDRAEALPGVGIGMAAAKAMIDAMDGTVSVRSEENGNTEFLIRLSFPVVSPAPETVSKESAGALELHVLLVDDNEINREIAELMLTAEGWTVEQATNGAEAVELVRAAEPGRFDVVLMDVQMPVMNGYEATAAIRALPEPEKAALPIIAVTANAYQEDASEAAAAGMDGYVSKPIDPVVIRTVVARVLGERSRDERPKEGATKDE